MTITSPIPTEKIIKRLRYANPRWMSKKIPETYSTMSKPAGRTPTAVLDRLTFAANTAPVLSTIDTNMVCLDRLHETFTSSLNLVS
jgi:hypothetical protein